MNCFLLLALASSCLAAPAPGQLPAGVSAYSCPNYPYCSGANTLSLAVPNVPGAADVIRAQEALIRGNLAPTAHAAAEAAIIQQSRGGYPAHAAAEKAVLMQQGRVPAGLNQGELQHFQAEAAVRAAEQKLIVSGLQFQGWEYWARYY